MRVLISGYYGFGNLGDEALLSGLIGGLRAQGHTPVVLSGDPRATEEQHGVEAVHRLRGLAGAVTRADALVSGGGGLLQDATSRRSLDYYLNVIRFARRTGKRVVVYGQSLGPLSSGGRDAVARCLRGLPVSVRDEQSVKLAREMGLAPVLVADPALLLASEGVEPLPEPDEAPVVLVPRGGFPQLNAVLEELAQELTEAEVPVAGIAFHPREDNGPLARMKRMVPELQMWEETDPMAVVRRLERARYVVSIRLHGCILAAVSGVGFAGISYDPKVKGFLSQAVAPTFEQPIDGRALLGVALGSPQAEEHAVAHLIRLSQEGMAWLGEALAGRAGARSGGRA